MTKISAAALQDAWEMALRRHPLLRALTLLELDDAQMPPEQLAMLSIGERDRRLFRLRERLIDRQFESSASCPQCGERVELSFGPQDFQAGETEAGGEVTVEHGGYTIRARVPNSFDLFDIARVPGPSAAQRLFAMCLLSAERDGAEVSADALPDSVVEMVQSHLAAADPMSDLHVALTCPQCEQAWSLPFDIGSYLWHEVDDRARKVLRDTHTLARIYGWSEADILALSDVRRQLYIDMVAGQ